MCVFNPISYPNTSKWDPTNAPRKSSILSSQRRESIRSNTLKMDITRRDSRAAEALALQALANSIDLVKSTPDHT